MFAVVLRKSVIGMYSHRKSSSGKEPFDDGNQNGVYVGTNSINTRKRINPKRENKLHRITEKSIDRDAKIQELRYGMNDIGRTSHQTF